MSFPLLPAGSATLSVGLGLVAATTWGGSDFVGGIAAKRSPALLVVVSGHLVTLLALLTFCFLGHLPIPGRTEFLEGAIGGIEGSIALAAFYRALAMGAMGLTAALTGLLTALVPVLYGFWNEGIPAPLAIGWATSRMRCHLAYSPRARPCDSAGCTVARGDLRHRVWNSIGAAEACSQWRRHLGAYVGAHRRRGRHVHMVALRVAAQGREARSTQISGDWEF